MDYQISAVSIFWPYVLVCPWFSPMVYIYHVREDIGAIQNVRSSAWTRTDSVRDQPHWSWIVETSISCVETERQDSSNLLIRTARLEVVHDAHITSVCCILFYKMCTVYQLKWPIM